MPDAYIRNGKLLVNSVRTGLLGHCPCVLVNVFLSMQYGTDPSTGITGLSWAWSLPTLTYSSAEQNPASALSLSGQGTSANLTPNHPCCDVVSGGIVQSANGEINDWSGEGPSYTYYFANWNLLDRAGTGRFEIDGIGMTPKDEGAHRGGAGTRNFKAEIQIGEASPSPCPVTATVAFSHGIYNSAWTTESSRLVVSGTDAMGSRTWTNNFSLAWSPPNFTSTNMWTKFRYDLTITRN